MIPLLLAWADEWMMVPFPNIERYKGKPNLEKIDFICELPEFEEDCEIPQYKH